MIFAKTTAKTALASVALAAALTLPATAQDVSVEIYGGITGKQSLIQNGVDYPMDIGSAYGAAVYVTAPVANLSFGIDYMATKAFFLGFPGEYAHTQSLMGVVRYEAPLSNSLTGYAGLGFGAMIASWENNGVTTRGVDPGAQLGLGLRYTTASGSQFFGEVKRQEAFSQVELAGGSLQEAKSNAFVVGYRHNF
jgi:hypothetical protein